MNSHAQTFAALSALAMAALAATAIPQTAHAADFPALKQQVDATVRPVGRGTCSTERTGTWLVDGGVVVAVKKPNGRCLFESLDLVVGQDRIPLTAANSSFYRGKKWMGGTVQAMMYEWTSDVGLLYFKTDRVVDPNQIRGLVEPSCQSGNCLDEASTQ